MSNQQLAEELHKTIINKFEKRKAYSFFRDNIWGADLADKKLISKLIDNINFYYVLLTFIVNLHELFF